MTLIPILASAALLEVGDPQILEDGGMYYLYGTDKGERAFSVSVSEDLVNWRNHAGAKPGGFVFDASDSFATNRFWAAECHKVGGKFYLFHSAGVQTAVAVGDSPLGPFRLMKREPIPNDGHTIDNTLFVDEDGRKYMVFSRLREDREWIEEICIAELEEDLMSIKPGTEMTLFGATEPWEKKTYNERVKGGTVEAPSLLKIDGIYILLYSANDCRSKEYCAGYAWAKNPYGPYVKCSAPFLRMAGGNWGTGHGSPFKDREGRWRYVFHSHRSATKFGPRLTHHVGLKIEVKDGAVSVSTEGGIVTCRDVSR